MKSLTGNVHVWLGCTKARSPGIGTDLHWRPPDVHIFDTDPSLVTIKYCNEQNYPFLNVNELCSAY